MENEKTREGTSQRIRKDSRPLPFHARLHRQHAHGSAESKREYEMTIAELHDYCRYLFDENHVHGVPDKWSEGYEFALSLVMFKCQEGLTDEDRKAVADWREKHWKDTK